MMHYSNWLIDVKNRASFRNEYKSPPNTDWIKRGNIADMQNNNPHLKEKASELAAAIHLLKKGKKSICSYISGPAANNSARVALFIRDRPYFVVSFNSNHVRTDVREAARVSSFLLQVKVEGEGVLRYQGDGQLTGFTLTALG